MHLIVVQYYSGEKLGRADTAVQEASLGTNTGLTGASADVAGEETQGVQARTEVIMG